MDNRIYFPLTDGCTALGNQVILTSSPNVNYVIIITFWQHFQNPGKMKCNILQPEQASKTQTRCSLNCGKKHCTFKGIIVEQHTSTYWSIQYIYAWFEVYSKYIHVISVCREWPTRFKCALYNMCPTMHCTHLELPFPGRYINHNFFL